MPRAMRDHYTVTVAVDDNGVIRRDHYTATMAACLLWLAGHERVISAEVSHVIAETTEGALRDAVTMRVRGFKANGDPFDIRVARLYGIVAGNILTIDGMRHDIVIIDDEGTVHVGRGY